MNPFIRALALLILSAAPAAPASAEPSVLIENSTASRIKGLALDTALARGWKLVDSASRWAIFETPLDQPASDGPGGIEPPDTTELRIRVSFEQLTAGALVSIKAEEIWWSGTANEWRTDVTRLYQENLQDALASLQQRWTSFVATSPVFPEAVVATDATFGDRPVGLWAYYAERYASAAGCNLDDRGATLVSTSGNAELHRVFCTERSPVTVQCDANGCRSPR